MGAGAPLEVTGSDEGVLENLKSQFGAALSTDMSDVEISGDKEAKEKTEAMGALGLMEDGKVLINPDKVDPKTKEGEEVVGHELAHAEQEKSGTKGGDAAGAEVEADKVGAAFAAKETVPKVEISLAGAGPATKMPGELTTGSGEGEFNYTLDVFGTKVTIPLSTDQKGESVKPLNVNIPGLSDLALRFKVGKNGESPELSNAKVTAKFDLFGLAKVKGKDNLELKVDTTEKNAGKVEASLSDVSVEIANFAKVTAETIKINSDGLEAKFMIGNEQIKMGPVTVNGGQITLKLKGKTLTTEGTADVALGAALAAGKMEVKMKDGTLEMASINGQLNIEGIAPVEFSVVYKSLDDISGSVGTTVKGDFFGGEGKADVEVSYSAKGEGKGKKSKAGYALKGNFEVKLPGVEKITIDAALENDKLSAEIDVKNIVGTLPGVTIDGLSGKLKVNGEKVSGSVSGKASFAEGKVKGAFKLNFGADGAFSGGISVKAGKTDIGGLTVKSFSIALDKAGNITSEGSGKVDLLGGKIKGDVNLEYKNDVFTVSGEKVVLTGLGYFKSLAIENFKINDKGEYSGTVSAQGDVSTKVGMLTLTVTDPSVTLDASGGVSGSLKGSITAEGDLFSGDFDVALQGEQLTGKGTLQVKDDAIPGLKVSPIQMTFPATGGPNIDNTDVEMNLFGGALTGTLTFSMKDGDLSISGSNVSLTVLGQKYSVKKFAYANGRFTMAADVKLPDIPGVTGNPTLEVGINEANNLYGTTLTPIKISVPELGVDGEVNFTYEYTPEGGKLTASGKGTVDPPVDFIKPVAVEFAYDEVKGLVADIEIKSDQVKIAGLKLDGSVMMRYEEGTLKLQQGNVGFQHETGKLTGNVVFTYGENKLNFTGKGEVKDVVDGLKPFEVTLTHVDGKTNASCPVVDFDRQFPGVKVTGKASELTYDLDKGILAGDIALKADFGAFGEAEATAKIAENEITEATFTFKSGEFNYPKSAPILKGTIGGTVKYAAKKFSGSLEGTADFKLPGGGAGEEGSTLGLAINAKMSEEGAFSGTIKTTKPLQVGKYIKIPSVEGTLTEKGDVNARFSVEVVNIPNVESAVVNCVIDEKGFSVEGEVTFVFGTENATKMWGKLKLGYSAAEGFVLKGEASVKIKEGMIATGSLEYSSKTNKISTKLGIKKFNVFDKTDKRNLFKLSKDIPVFSLAGILGLYVSPAISLDFDYVLKLDIEPSVELKDLSLEDFSFSEAIAQLKTGGEISAALTATPSIGVGIFVLSPMLLKGGGGIKVPITAKASVDPSATFKVSYKPDGGVDGEAKMHLALDFEIKGSVVPYAEFSVLDGAYEKSWTGDSLADFTILPKTELFALDLDVGGDTEKQKEPTIPTTAEPSKGPKGGGKVMPQKAAGKKDTAVAADKNKAGREPTEGGADGPFSIAGLGEQFLSKPSLAGLKKALEAAGAAWDMVKGSIKAIGAFFSKWFTKLSDTFTQVMEGIAKAGSFTGYLKDVLKRNMNADVFYVLEPGLDGMISVESKLTKLLGMDFPKDFDTALEWLMAIYDLGFSSLATVISSINQMVGRLGAVFGKFVNQMVQNGKIKVWRSERWYWAFGTHYFWAADQYEINLPGFSMKFKGGSVMVNPKNAVAYGLWALLESMSGVHHTHEDKTENLSEGRNAYWAG